MKTLKLKSFSPLISTMFLFLVSMNWHTAHAQPFIENADFETLNLSASCILSPFFDAGCMDLPPAGGWISGSGRPSRTEESSCETNSPEDEASAVFSIGRQVLNGNQISTIGSSLVYDFPNNLAPGDYTLSFCYEGLFIEGSPDVDLKVELAKGISNGPIVGVPLITGIYQEYQDQANNKPLSNVNSISLPVNIGLITSEWDEYTIEFTVSPNQQFNQLWFYGVPADENIGVSKICIDNVSLALCPEEFDCIESFNLTACSEDGSTGYIDLSCGSGSTYHVDLPAGSVANVYDCGPQFLITNANAGTYTVTITNVNGCTATRAYEVIETCCKDIECPTPENLSCANLFGQTYLTWTAIPNVTYEVCVYTGTCGSPDQLLTFPSTSNFFNIKAIGSRSFEWTVKAVCNENVLSDAPATICFDIQECNGISDGFSTPGSAKNREALVKKLSIDAPIIYPNPSRGQFKIALSPEGQLTERSELAVYDQLGKLVFHTRTNETLFEMDLEGIPSGIYFVNILIGDQIFTEKLIIQ